VLLILLWVFEGKIGTCMDFRKGGETLKVSVSDQCTSGEVKSIALSKGERSYEKSSPVFDDHLRHAVGRMQLPSRLPRLNRLLQLNLPHPQRRNQRLPLPQPLQM
jgi:hypothetical protein